MAMLSTKYGVSGCARSTTSKLWSIALISLAMSVCSCFLGILQASAQTAHSATLTWSAPSDATTGSTYNIYRATGACPTSGLGTLTFAKVNAAPITALTYVDSGLTVGTYCYYATQVQSSTESLPSNTAGGPARPGTITVQIVIQ